MKRSPRVCIILYLLIAAERLSETAAATENELTVNIAALTEDCFYQECRKGDTIDIEYQVIDGGHGDLDITFHLVDPNGRILVADYKKSENNHQADATVDGPYRFCFDNTFSSYNTKTVFFELIVEGRDDDDAVEYAGVRPEDVYDVTVDEVQAVVSNVRINLNKVRQVQELLKSTEARDRNIAEENYFKVNTFSLVQLCVMLLVGLMQVVMVKGLFDDTSTVHRIWNQLSSKYNR